MMRRSVFSVLKSCVSWSIAGLLVVNSATAQAQEIQAQEMQAATTIDFEKQVAPILTRHCVECHDSKLQMAELRLDSRQAMLDAGVLVPGEADNSSLIQRMKNRELGILMPPTGRISEAQVKSIENWVNAGAKWPAEIKLGDTRSDNKADARSGALFEMIRNGDIDELRKMLTDGSMVNATNQHGATPLMLTSLFAGWQSVELLLDRGADVHATDNDGLTALMYAAGSDAKTVRLLLDRGAKVDAQSKLGRNSLLIASAYPHNVDVVKLLLAAGADPKFADRRNWTTAVMAARTGDRELLTTLLDAGAEINGGNAKRLSPGTPLMQAAWASDVVAAKFLLNRGAATDQRSLDASLISASVQGSSEIVELLLDAGANAESNIRTNYIPESPILAATGSDAMNADIVKTLLARDVDTQQKDNRGETPLSLALQRGESEIVQLLRGKKAEKDSVADEIDSAKIPDSSEQAIRKLAQKSVSLLQSCGPKFFAKSGCTACHQQSTSALVVRMARERGFKIDERISQQQAKLTAVDLLRKRTGFLQRMKSGGAAHRLGYLLWGLAEAKYPADDVTDFTYVELAGLQRHDGSWVSDAHRPPTEYSSVTATAVSLQALKHYSPPGLKKQTDRRIRRATDWLVNVNANANAEKAFRLLGLHWGDADQTHIEKAKRDLLAEQKADGGWSQLSSLAADAYATGLTMYALGQTGFSVDDSEYRKGVNFLLIASKSDGSWHVRTRSFAFQPYFESGFPHGHDQWISAAATGWATLALLQTIEPSDAESVESAAIEQ